ncbi:MAG: putative type polysaccharide/polyol phosphate export system that might be involved in cell [Ramlibacter sp.]|jgi:ABC-type polysaccharide/polyol phosphate transport system ATPase subunit|nr:putative type polysaccharide/polyol phosphate export system that might be involved in cell [Ramlibacter sp.]
MTRLMFDTVTVQYPVFNSRNKSLRNHLVRLSTGGLIEQESAGVRVVTALRDVSFELREGDRVGLVGHNGAGKSTLLRTMAGIYAPVAGTVARTGRIATVLELGAGMDGELSGYENIRRMSMLLGRTAAEAQEALPEIEAFTQLGHFLDLPVRTYSSGMTTRLMFAVATSTSPDILLLDEVFGAGDAEFQQQARERMEALIASVGIFVFASHEHDKLKRYCGRFFRLEHGTLAEVSAGDI